MNKLILMFIILLLTISPNSAELTDSQLDRAINEMSDICQIWDKNQIKEYILESDCTPGEYNAFLSNCGDRYFEYRCINGVHYLDGIDITSLPQIDIEDSILNINSPNSNISISNQTKNFNLKIPITIKVSIIGGIITISLIINFKLRKKKAKKKLK